MWKDTFGVYREHELKNGLLFQPEWAEESRYSIIWERIVSKKQKTFGIFFEVAKG